MHSLPTFVRPALVLSILLASFGMSAQATTADLLVAVIGPQSALNGTEVNYQFNIGNNGPDTVPSVTGTLVLPAGVATEPRFNFWGGVQGCTRPGATNCARSPWGVFPEVTCWLPGNAGAQSITCTVSASGGIGPSAAAGNFGSAFIAVKATTAGPAIATATVDGDPSVTDNNAANNTSQKTTSIEPMADLSAALDAAGNAIVGQGFAYTATVSNAGPNDAISTTLVVTLPANVSWVSTSGSNCSGTSTITCGLGTIASGGSAAVTINVMATATGQAKANAAVSSSTADVDTADLANDATTTVTTTPVTGSELQIAGSVANSTAIFSQSVIFTFVLTNNGPDSTGNVSTAFTLPPGWRISSFTGGGGATCSFTGNPATGFTCQVPSMANGDTRTMTAGTKATTLGPVTASFSATTTATDRDTSNNTSQVALTVVPANADISAGTYAPMSAVVGSTIAYHFSLTNHGPDTVDTITGTLTLPAEASVPTSFVFPGGWSSCTRPGATMCGSSPYTVRPTVTCWYPGSGGSGTVTCEVHDGGGLGPDGYGGTGGSATINTTATAVGLATATAATDNIDFISDSNSANDTASTTTRIVNDGETDMSIAQTAPVSSLINQQFDYTLTVRNIGPITATNVTVVDQLPSAVTFVSASGSGVTCSGTSTISCVLGDLTAYRTATIAIRVTATALGIITNTATVTATEQDADPSNNMASAALEIRQVTSDLVLTATGPATAVLGRNFTLNIGVENRGPDAATGVRIRGTLPDGVTMGSYNYGCYAVGGGFECALSYMYRNSSSGANVQLQGSAVGPKHVAITLTQNNFDSDTTNNARTYDIEIVPPPTADLTATLSVPPPMPVGATLVYTLTAHNLGPDPATSLTVNSAFPIEALDNESATGSLPGACGVHRGGATLGGVPATIVVCSTQQLDAGQSWTITVSGRAAQAGVFALTGHVSGSGLQEDPDHSNDSLQSNLIIADPLVLTCPSSVTVPTDSGAATAALVTAAAATTGGLAPISLTASRSDGLARTDPYPLGTTSITWTASDAAGQHAECVQTVTVVDREAPAVSCQGPDAVWHADNVTLACTASDAASGLADPAHAAFTVSTSVAGGLADANAPTNSVQVCDHAGNCASAGPIAGNRIDRELPVVTMTVPLAGSSVVLNASVRSAFDCTDGAGSGIATCSGPSIVDTATVGQHTFTATASDNVGNATTTTTQYQVTYGAGTCQAGGISRLVQPPIDPNGGSVFKQGRTVPVRIRVCDGNGVSVGAPGTITSFALVQIVSGTVSSTVNEDPPSTTPDPDFRWDSVEQQWIFNLNTRSLLPAHTYVYRIQLNDGTTITFRFGLI